MPMCATSGLNVILGPYDNDWNTTLSSDALDQVASHAARKRKLATVCQPRGVD